MAGKKGDLDFKITADPMRAITDLSKLVSKQEEVIQKLKQQNAEARKVDGGMRNVGDTAKNTLGSIMAWAGGLLTIGTAVRGIRAVVAEMEKAVALRQGMHQAALSVEELALKLAQVRGDMSAAGRKTAISDIFGVSRQTSIPPAVAKELLFYAESTFPGQPAMAKATATDIAKFAGPAGLMPEDVQGIARIFKAVGAKTTEERKKVLGQIYEATSKSIAETGPFLQAFTKPMITTLERGFTLPQSLALMGAAVEASGDVAEAGTTAASGIAVIAGRTEKAVDYLTKEGKRRGVDFMALTDIQRLEFMRVLYDEAKAGGPKTMTKMGLRMGPRGFDYLRRLYSPLGQQQYELIQTAAGGATGAIIDKMFGEYEDVWMTAEQTQAERRKTQAQAKVGQERRPDIVLREMTQDAVDLAKARLEGPREYIGMGLRPAGKERDITRRMILRENLALAMEQAQPGTGEAENIARMAEEMRNTLYLTAHPELIEEIYKATEGFTLIEKAKRLAGKEAYQGVMPANWNIETPSLRDPVFMRGVKELYGVEKTPAEKLLEQLLEEVKEMNRNMTAGVPAAAVSED